MFKRMKTFFLKMKAIKVVVLMYTQLKNLFPKIRPFQVVASVMFILGLVLAMFPETSFAANSTVITGTGAPFASIYTLVSTWLTGPLMTTIALTAVIMGLGIGIARQSPVAALSGIAFAVIASVLPGVITGILGAVV